MDSTAKVYDIMLSKRLAMWFSPDREQAGSQKKRGCIEHLLTLRLLIDLARKKRQKLYIAYIDFSKAYDRVPRDLLVRKLIEMGCGSLMVRAIAAIYSCTRMILRTAILTATIGVRQGSPTSCFLFTLAVNDLLRNLKLKCPPDGWLGWLHALMLMDDTVIVATSRHRVTEKLKVLNDFCHSSGMIINSSKTKFMVINGNEEDRQPLKEGALIVNNCDAYTYLGLIFTQDGKMTTAVKAQCNAKMPHVVKFEAFIKKNSDMPFEVKKKVFSAALASAILYGCETWLSPVSIESAAPMYHSCVRSLLGVRKTTASDLCLVEAGLPSLPERTKTAQHKVIWNLIHEREHMVDDPFAHVWKMASEANTPCARYIHSLEIFDPQQEREKLISRIRNSARTKFITYQTLMNPRLEQHGMYLTAEVREYQRLTVTKFRLSSHNLAVETGRWSRKPREARLCPLCRVVQDECHALAECQMNNDARALYNVNFSLPDFFSIEHVPNCVKICHHLMKDFI